jgi:hypothetical protein
MLYREDLEDPDDDDENAVERRSKKLKLNFTQVDGLLTLRH